MKFRKNINIGAKNDGSDQRLAKTTVNSAKFGKKNWTNFCLNFEARAMKKHVNLIDIFQRILLANIGFDAAENGPFKAC